MVQASNRWVPCIVPPVEFLSLIGLYSTCTLEARDRCGTSALVQLIRMTCSPLDRVQPLPSLPEHLLSTYLSLHGLQTPPTQTNATGTPALITTPSPHSFQHHHSRDSFTAMPERYAVDLAIRFRPLTSLHTSIPLPHLHASPKRIPWAVQTLARRVQTLRTTQRSWCAVGRMD